MPGQKFTSTIVSEFKKDITIQICYEGLDNEKYSEKFSVKTDMSSDLLWFSHKLSTDDNLATAIKMGAQSISKTLKQSTVIVLKLTTILQVNACKRFLNKKKLRY